LADQVLKGPIITFDAVWVLGVAAQDSFLPFYQKASHIHSDVEERAAVRLNQCPFLQFFPIQNEHKFCILLCRGCERRLAI